MSVVLGNLGAGRTVAIYGDANTQQATIVPDLTKAADGTNLTVSANSDELNTFQSLNLNDLVYETTSEELYANVVSAGNVSIQGNLLGWADMTKMYLELNPSFTFSGWPTNLTDPTKLPNIAYPFQFTNLSLISNQPSFAMLSPLIKFEIQMGENNQIIGRQMMNQLEHIKLVAQDNKMEDADFDEMSQLGLPLTRNFPFLGYNANNGSTVQTSFMGDATTTSVTEKLINRWNARLSDLIYYAFLQQYNTLQPATFSGLNYLSNQVTYIGIPLRYLNSFFKEKAFLPPGLKFRFNIEYNSGVSYPIATVPITYYDANQTPKTTFTFPLTVNVSWGTNMRLTYKRSQLRQPAQERINNMWLSRPFLFNYLTYEYVSLNTDGVTKIYTQDLAISQQRPTSIFMKVNPQITSGTTSRTLATSISALNAITSNTLINTTDYPYSECAAICFSEIKIFIAGRQTVYYRTSNQKSNVLLPYFKDASQLINNAANKHVDQDMDQNSPFASTFQSSFDGTFLQISLNPGDMQKNGNLSSDMGAVVIRIEFTLTNNTTDQSTGVSTPTGDYLTVPKGYKILFYKKLQEQLQLDAAKNITTITWPAVKSNSGFLISNTYNVN